MTTETIWCGARVLAGACVLAAGCAGVPVGPASTPPVLSSEYLFVSNDQGSACFLNVHEKQAFAGAYEASQKTLTLSVGFNVGDDRGSVVVVAQVARADVAPGTNNPFATRYPVRLATFAIADQTYSATAEATVPPAAAAPGAVPKNWPPHPLMGRNGFVSREPAVSAALPGALRAGSIIAAYSIQNGRVSDVWRIPPLEKPDDLKHLAAFDACIEGLRNGRVFPAPQQSSPSAS